jgi:hypothetical protein
LAPREVVLGMDDTERKISFLGVVIAMVVSLVPAYEWINKSALLTTRKVVKGKACPATFHLKGQLCEHVLENAQSHWAIQFLFGFVLALIILFFALKRKRAGVACFAVFLGIGLGVTGVVFVFLGGWLIVRAFRLQRYGDPTWSGSNAIAREMAKAKREGRDPTPSPKSTSKSKSNSASASTSNQSPPPGPAAPPAPSKRYTPKQKPRKR